MSLRRSSQPATTQLPAELSGILERNGMRAAIVGDASGQPRLMVQGHDSPVLTYNLDSRQLSALTGRGSTYLDKLAYNTFASIVSGDFDLPRNYVHARNVNSRVAMGLHGYRIGAGEYGRMTPMTPRQAFMRGMPMSFCGNPRQRGFWQVLSPLLGWTGRQQDGFHLRRMGGVLVTPQGAPIVPQRPDGRLKPGELQSGGYGFYWKGGSLNREALPDPAAGRAPVDPLQGLKPLGPRQSDAANNVDRPAPVRSQEPARPYKELVTSPVYFTADRLLECLSSHGLIIDTKRQELTVQSTSIDADITYSLSDKDLAVLVSPSIKEHPLEQRLAVLNGVLKEDFRDPVTMEMLDSSDKVSISLNDEAKAELSHVGVLREQERASLPLDPEISRQAGSTIQTDGLVIPLVSEREGWHWQQDINHGRDVILGNVIAYERQGRAFLRADINGQTYTKELSAGEFQEIHYRNDSRRLELVDMHLDGIRLEKGDYKGEAVISSVTHGHDLDALSNGGKGWYREGAEGRAVEVGDISVSRQGSRYVMTAEIDGQTIQHEISQKDFNRFLQMDDYHRMKLFARIYDEVDIKHSLSLGARIGAAFAATLTVMGEMTAGIDCSPGMSHGDAPMVHGHAVRPYFKPGVDSPMDIAARNFEAAMVTDQIQHGLRH